jgi:hypothetical protein
MVNNGKGLGHDLTSQRGRLVSERWRINRPRQRVAKDVNAAVAWQRPTGDAQKLEHLVVAALAQTARMEWYRTDDVNALPCRLA